MTDVPKVSHCCRPSHPLARISGLSRPSISDPQTCSEPRLPLLPAWAPFVAGPPQTPSAPISPALFAIFLRTSPLAARSGWARCLGGASAEMRVDNVSAEESSSQRWLSASSEAPVQSGKDWELPGPMAR